MLSALVEGDGPLAIAATWAGTEGRSALDGLAVVTEAATADVAWFPTHSAWHTTM